MTTPALIDEFRLLSETIAPEVRDVPFHVLLRPPLPVQRETAAYVIRGRDVALRDYLRSIGQWQGHYGPTIVFVDPPEDRLACLALLVHELAHCLPPLVLDDVDPSPHERQRQRREVLAWASADPMRASGEPWAGHGLRWLRRVVNLWFRSLQVGVPLRLVDLQAAGPCYGLSPLRRYVSALGAEPFDLQRLTFREVESVPPPAKFAELFERDVATWKAKQKA